MSDKGLHQGYMLLNNQRTNNPAFEMGRKYGQHLAKDL